MDSTQDRYLMNLQEIENKLILGHGRFSTVYAGEYKGKNCAIKVMDFNSYVEIYNSQASIQNASENSLYSTSIKTLSKSKEHEASTAKPEIKVTFAEPAKEESAKDNLTDTKQEPTANVQDNQTTVAKQNHETEVKLSPFTAHLFKDFKEICDREIKAMVLLTDNKAPHSIHLQGFYQTEFKLHIAMDFADNGRLTIWLDKLPFNLQIQTMIQVSIALQFLHNLNLVHCDIKPDNVLMDKNLSAKLADFGFTESPSASLPPHGTPFFMAPELLNCMELAPNSQKSDIYALGLLMWMLVNQKKNFPYEAQLNSYAIHDLYRLIYNRNYREPIPKSCLPKIKMLIERAWDSNPLVRPELKDILHILEKIDLQKDSLGKTTKKTLVHNFFNKSKATFCTFTNKHNMQLRIESKNIKDFSTVESIIQKLNYYTEPTYCLLLSENKEKVENIEYFNQLNPKKNHSFYVVYKPVHEHDSESSLSMS